jgi:ABC-type transport system substrate-binding protein
VERGAADYAEADPEALAAVPARYRSQLHAAGGASIRFVVLNSARPLFRGNSALRRAVNFAVDRRALVAVRGGSITGRLTDQYLPASMPGFRDARVYPLTHPDLPRARALARGHTRNGTAALWVKDTPTDIAQAEIIKRNLQPLGLRVTVTKLQARRSSSGSSRRAAPTT